MGWSDLIWRRFARGRTTVMQVAASLAEAIIQSTNLLQVRLCDEGFTWSDPARAGTDDCLLECTIFEWFLRDVAESGRFGSKAEAVRQALAARVLIDLQRSGLSPACLANFDRRYRERFSEYAEALSVSSSLQPLGALAWRRISSDRPSERMTMLFAIRARAELATLPGSNPAIPVTRAPDGRRSSTAMPVREAPWSG